MKSVYAASMPYETGHCFHLPAGQSLLRAEGVFEKPPLRLPPPSKVVPFHDFFMESQKSEFGDTSAVATSVASSTQKPEMQQAGGSTPSSSKDHTPTSSQAKDSSKAPPVSNIGKKSEESKSEDNSLNTSKSSTRASEKRSSEKRSSASTSKSSIRGTASEPGKQTSEKRKSVAERGTSKPDTKANAKEPALSKSRASNAGRASNASAKSEPATPKECTPSAKLQAVTKKMIFAGKISENFVYKLKKAISEADPSTGGKIGNDMVSFDVADQGVLWQYFSMHDTDTSHSLSFAELREVMDDIGRMPDKGTQDMKIFNEMLRKYDEDKSGDLDFNEFLIFLAEFYRNVYHRIFKAHCIKNTTPEYIPADRFKHVLDDVQKAGFEIDQEKLEDMVYWAEFGEKITFPEFCTFMCEYRSHEFVMLHQSAGFSTQQLEFMHEAFEGHDVDKSGELDIKEVSMLFQTTFEPVEDIDYFVELFARKDMDRTASLNFQEFLSLLRVWNKVTDRCKEGKGDTPLNISKTAEIKERTQTITEMVCVDLDNQSVAEDMRRSLQKAKITTGVFSESWAEEAEDSMLALQWGLSLQEVYALRECFEFCDSDGSGHIDSIELQPLLANLGFPPNTCKQKEGLTKCLEQLQKDKQELDFKNTVIFVHNYHKTLARLVAESTEGPSTSIPAKQLVMAMYQIGQFLPRDKVNQLLVEVAGDEACDWSEISEDIFAKMMGAHVAKSTIQWKQCRGFMDEDIGIFRKAFDKHKEMPASEEPTEDVVLVENVLKILLQLGYPVQEQRDRSALVRGLVKADREKRGSITFQELLLVLRHVENKLHQQCAQEEKTVVRAMSLGSADVHMFRAAFQSVAEKKAGCHGLLVARPHDIKVLLTSKFCIAKTQEQRKTLDGKIHEILEAEFGIEHGSEGRSFTFCVFLRLLQYLDKSGLF